MTDSRRRLGAHLRALRRERNLTQEQLAERANVHPTYITRIEAGRSMPALDVLTRLAAALGVSTAELVRVVEQRESAADADLIRQEIRRLLDGASHQQLALIRDFAALLRRGGYCSGDR